MHLKKLIAISLALILVTPISKAEVTLKYSKATEYCKNRRELVLNLSRQIARSVYYNTPQDLYLEYQTDKEKEWIEQIYLTWNRIYGFRLPIYKKDNSITISIRKILNKDAYIYVAGNYGYILGYVKSPFNPPEKLIKNMDKTVQLKNMNIYLKSAKLMRDGIYNELTVDTKMIVPEEYTQEEISKAAGDIF